MAPTPEQLLIEQQPNLIQQPQVQEQIQQAPVIKEGQVGMPTPEQWIGPIDYGMDWYALGSKAFKVAGDLYGDLLQYNVMKTGAKISDLQYDLRSKMENTFSESITTEPKNYVDRPNEVDFNLPFDRSKSFQEEYKSKANEIIGFKDSDGNLVDVFSEDFDFENTGAAWFRIIDGARSGLYEITRDAERVQSDLLKSFKENTNQRVILDKYMAGEYVSKSDLEKIEPFLHPTSKGTIPVNNIIETLGTENVNLNARTSTGSPVIIVDANKNAYINPQASEQEIANAVGLSGYQMIKENDYATEMSARGQNISSQTADKVRQFISSNNISQLQATELKSILKYMSPEKLNYMMTISTDFTPIQRARLFVAYANSGIYPGQEELNPETYHQKINNIKTSDANALSGLIRFISKDTSPEGQGFGPSLSVLSSFETTKNIYNVLVGAVDSKGNIIDQSLYDISQNQDTFKSFLQDNPELQPIIYSSLLEYETLTRNGIDPAVAKKTVAESLNSIVWKDSEGKPVVSRNSRMVLLGTKGLNEESPSSGWYGDIKNNITQISKLYPNVNKDEIEKFNQQTPQEAFFRNYSLNQNFPTEDLPSLIESVDTNFIPSQTQLLNPEDRVGLMNSLRTVHSDKGQNRGANITLGEAVRLSIATNPSVIRDFNGGRNPQNKKEALQAAAKAYRTIGSADNWGWKFKNSSRDDQLLNSQQGGVPFNLSSIPYLNEAGEEQDLMNNRFVVSPANKENIRFTASNGLPFTMIENNSLNQESMEEARKTFERKVLNDSPYAIEIQDGITPITAEGDEGLVSAAQLLVRTEDQKDLLIHGMLKDGLSAKEITLLSRELSQHEAYMGLKDSYYVDYVADVLSKNFPKKPKTFWVSALSEIADNELLAGYITKVDTTKETSFTNLDLLNNMTRAAIGYSLNSNFKESLMEGDVYPKPEVSYFWGEALKPVPIVVPTKKPQEESVMSQTLGGAGELLKATGQTIFPIDLIMDTKYESVWSQAAKALFRPGATAVDFDLSTGMMSAKEAKLYNQGLEEVNKQSQKIKEIEQNKTGMERLNERRSNMGSVSDKPYVNLISEFEGLKTEAYWDDAGKVWTIGKGTTRYPDGTPVKQGDKITEQQAQEYLVDYVNTRIIPTLQETVPTWNDLNNNQKAALISFSYNLGENFYNKKGFETITKALSNKENLKNVPQAFRLYVKAGGKKLKGLERRRKAEADLWSSN